MADSPLPLYHKVYLLIRQRLLAGGFAPQTALPGENALAAEYGVSRLTIRRSLEALEADGLIERHQGRGTFAALQSAASSTQHSSDMDSLMVHLARMGMQTQVTLLALDTIAASSLIAAHLEQAPGTAVQRAIRVRSHENQPFSYLTTYVPQTIGQAITHADLVSKPLLAIFRDLGIQVARAEQTISAVLAEPDAAAALNVPVGSALLSLQRRVRAADGQPVEWLHALYRPDRYKYRMDMQAHNMPGQPTWLPAGTPST
ncbi:GntR family transcriptional regulator [Bordetella holmesii]|uniref:UbiC transcription regulator-associated domain protein n=3 Tax=Bordetella holmesii TaxID=35814 RepID=A0A158M6E3_9BORD|nr:GntR family transcriptional regulator [Bordetella holmesii]AHV91166.1 deoR-like helix-turn-helix domain protein [Bordetella holmesii ATCC 51541]AIT25690.1 deoR-like helix-turn-helix domain protein [Bordetella holmesii 44057]EWM43059.1 deoR-like helix-turn-helix domain protein [Bordetella holmesii 41130]EWM46258.1 deoR-like helix-turn-helix domain protein [Bordetella holmesii 35009]AMD44833.1 GntR family transcriptional regulator [Bordetella holmesii H558]